MKRTIGTSQNGNPVIILQPYGCIEKRMISYKKRKQAHYKIIYKQDYFQRAFYRNITESHHKQKHKIKYVKYAHIDDLLPQKLSGKFGSGYFHAKTEGYEQTPCTQAVHQLLGLSCLLFVYYEETDSQNYESYEIYNKEEIVHAELHLSEIVFQVRSE